MYSIYLFNVDQIMKTSAFKMVLVALLAIGGGITSFARGDLTVVVKNLRSTDGKVLLSVGSKYAMKEITGDSVTLELAEVPEGKCVVSAFHDENGNYQLDKEGEIPIENCVMKEVVIEKGKQSIVLELLDLRDKTKK